jgi:hypothetical protein
MEELDIKFNLDDFSTAIVDCSAPADHTVTCRILGPGKSAVTTIKSMPS